MRARTASSATATASDAPPTGEPSGPLTRRSRVVDDPGVSVSDRGTASTVRVRVAVDTGSVIDPVAYAGRGAASGNGLPSSAVRGALPTTSIVTSRLGTHASRIGIGTTAEPPVTSKPIVSTIAPRLRTAVPWPSNGAPTSSSAVSPTGYVSRSGTIVNASAVRVRAGAAPAPATHTVSSLRLVAWASSVTVALIR